MKTPKMSGSTRLRSEEEGAVAVIVAVSMIMFFAAAAIAIDLGSAWSTKRDLNTDLDAAALAGARTLADEVRIDPNRCGVAGGTTSLRGAVRASVRSLLVANGGRADVADGEITIDCDRMTVRVAGSQPAATAFAGALGVDEINPAGYAIARARFDDRGDLLPISFCRDAPPVNELIDEGPGAIVTIPFASSTETLCGTGSFPPHWGYWGGQNANQLSNWVQDGPDPSVIRVQLPPELRCDAYTTATTPGWCSGDTGHKNTVIQRLGTRWSCSSGDPFPEGPCPVVTFLLHDVLECGSNCASSAQYQPLAFLDAVVRGVVSNPASNASITLEFVRLRDGEGEISMVINSSDLCSADGAPDGDPNCGA